MKILDKYQLKQIASGFIFIGLILMIIVWLTQSIKIMDMIITNGISLGAFLKLTILVLPNFIIVISPIVIFVMCFFCYSRMSIDREIHVLRATGMSSLRISRPAFIFAIFITLLNYALVFYVIPASFAAFRQLQWELRYDLSNILIKEGEFISLGKNLNLFIKDRDNQGNLFGIMINDNRSPESKSTTLAEKGALINSTGAPKIIMENGIRQENSTKSNRFSSLKFDKYLIDFDIVEEATQTRQKKAKELYIWELLTYDTDDGFDEDTIRKFRVEAHARIVKPLYNILFYIIASIGVLASSFSRYGQTKATVVTISIMVTFQALQIATENLADGNIMFIPLLYINIIIPIIIGYYILKNDMISNSIYKIKKLLKKNINDGINSNVY